MEINGRLIILKIGKLFKTNLQCYISSYDNTNLVSALCCYRVLFKIIVTSHPIPLISRTVILLVQRFHFVCSNYRNGATSINFNTRKLIKDLLIVHTLTSVACVQVQRCSHTNLFVTVSGVQGSIFRIDTYYL